MDRAVGGIGPPPVRSDAAPRERLRHRHAAADGQRIAPRRSRLFLHPHGRRRPISPHARQGCVLPDGVGRQRSADRAACAELLRRQVRSLAGLRPRICSAGESAEAADIGVAAQLHRAVHAPDCRGRKSVRASMAVSWPVGRLVDDLRDDRQAFAAHLAARVSAPAPAAARVSTGSADLVGRGLQNRCRAGRARGPGYTRRLSPNRVCRGAGGCLRPGRRRVAADGRNRDHTPGADPGVRGAGRAPRR